MKKIIKFFLGILVCLFVAFVFIIILLDHSGIERRISESLIFSFKKLIPSLYFSLVAALMLIETNLYIYIGKTFSFVAKRIFGVSEKMFSVFVLSNFAGYPTGAKLLSNLGNNGIIGKEDIRKASPVMFSAGPAFIFAVSDSETEGIIIFLSVVLSNVIVFFIYGRIFGLKNKFENEKEESEVLSLSSDVFVSSIISAFSSMINIVALTSFFSVFTSVLCDYGYDVISPVLEISSVSKISVTGQIFIMITSGYISFGGLCVIFQIAAELKKNLSMKRFLTVRLLSSVLSSLISVIIIHLFYGADTKTVFFIKDVNLNGIHVRISDYIFPAFAIMIILIYKIENFFRKYKLQRM